MLDALAGQRLRRAPGTGPGAYSNFGAGLLGIALRRVTGAGSYAELAEQTVLRPLELGDTVVQPSPEQSVRLAQGHGLFGRPVADWYLEGLAGAGALRSTVPDLLSYLRAQLDPELDPAGRGDPADPRAVAARSPAHVRAGLDAHPAAGR